MQVTVSEIIRTGEESRENFTSFDWMGQTYRPGDSFDVEDGTLKGGHWHAINSSAICGVLEVDEMPPYEAPEPYVPSRTSEDEAAALRKRNVELQSKLDAAGDGDGPGPDLADFRAMANTVRSVAGLPDLHGRVRTMAGIRKGLEEAQEVLTARSATPSSESSTND